MKKIYSLLAMSALVGGAFAQSPYAGKAQLESSLTIEKPNVSLKAPSDTTGWSESGFFFPEFATGGSIYRYGYTGGGSVYGSNNDSLNYCAQGYQNANQLTFDIEEVLVWAYRKHVANPNSTMAVEIYKMAANKAVNDNGSGGAALNSEGPSTLLGSATLSLAAVDTNVANYPNLTPVAFTTPVTVTGSNFAIALNAQSFQASGDTIGLFSDDDGEGQLYAFHKIGANWWVTDFVFGGLNNNIGLFAVIGNSNVGIDSDEFFNGVQMSAYPNPVSVNSTIEFNLNKAFTNVKVEVIDASGKNVATINKGALAQGNYKEVVDFSNLAAGKYYYSVITNESRLTKKIMVVK